LRLKPPPPAGDVSLVGGEALVVPVFWTPGLVLAGVVFCRGCAMRDAPDAPAIFAASRVALLLALRLIPSHRACKGLRNTRRYQVQYTPSPATALQGRRSGGATDFGAAAPSRRRRR